MKLELKHLAPYLPYGLSILDGWGDVRTLDYSYLNNIHCKPILRPLSDLMSGEFMDNIISQKERIEIKKLNTCHWLSYNSFQYLLKHHFDVFGLIEKGIAIDINTLNS
jgi:hypothetical protein